MHFAVLALATHDVTAVRYRVMDAALSCEDPPLFETTVGLEDDSRVVDGASSDFSDAFFTLEAGDYRVCATPLTAEGYPSALCAPAQTLATVSRGLTTEVELIAECGGSSGALDAVTVISDPPDIDALEILPSKFIDSCETASLVVRASDAFGQPLDIAWDVLSGSAPLATDGATASFGPASPGDYTLRVRVTDVRGAHSELVFPLHVTAGACDTGCEPGTEVAFEGRCYYLDGATGACDPGYALAPQSVLGSIGPDFVGKTYKHEISSNCCIVHANQDAEGQDYGMWLDCNAPGPFIEGPILGGAGCTNADNEFTGQLTLCVKE